MSDEEEAQGKFEEVLREAEPRPSAREEALRGEAARTHDEAEAPDDPVEPDPGPEEPAADETDATDARFDEVLGEALDRLEASVSLLLDRHRRLAERCREAEETSAEAREMLSRLAEEGLDPDALERRMRDLEEENDRLTRHAEHLEERIRGLLARVRYVVEA